MFTIMIKERESWKYISKVFDGVLNIAGTRLNIDTPSPASMMCLHASVPFTLHNLHPRPDILLSSDILCTQEECLMYPGIFLHKFQTFLLFILPEK